MTQHPGPGQPPAADPAHPGSALHPSGVPFTPPAVPPPPGDGQWRPARIDPVAGTEFGLVQLEVPGAASGLATGSLIAGVASVLTCVLVLCFGVAGSAESWGGWVSGAFALLAVLIGGGAIALGLIARRQIRRSGQDGRLRFTGRGIAVAGISCGAAGVGIALLFLALALVLQVT